MGARVEGAGGGMAGVQAAALGPHVSPGTGKKELEGTCTPLAF